MSIKDKLMKFRPIQDSVLYKNYKNNVHDVDLKETIQTGVVDRLMKARELGISYCVVLGRVTPTGPSWDPYGNGNWNPLRDYITTDDIKTKDNDREKELQNIYNFLRGETIEKDKNMGI